MLITTVVRSWVALFFALLIPLSSSPSIVSRVGDQEGATLGRAVFYVAVGVALVWPRSRGARPGAGDPGASWSPSSSHWWPAGDSSPPARSRA